MIVKWHGCQSTPRNINGGNVQGGTFGILGYLSQSNNSADMVPEQDRFKFIDDLSTLELIDLISIGFAWYNVRQHIPFFTQSIHSNGKLKESKLAKWNKLLDRGQ